MLPLLALAVALAAEPGWRAAGQAGGVSWATRERPGTEIKEVLATSTLEVAPAAVWAVLLDFEGYVATMPSTAQARVLAREGTSVAWVYLRYQPPLIAPRDTVVRMESQLGPSPGECTLRWTVAEDGDARAPLAEGTIRLRDNEGSWHLEPRAAGASTFVTYRLFSSPGGAVPAFFVNQVTGLGLPETFARLRQAALRRGP